MIWKFITSIFSFLWSTVKGLFSSEPSKPSTQQGGFMDEFHEEFKNMFAPPPVYEPPAQVYKAYGGHSGTIPNQLGGGTQINTLEYTTFGGLIAFIVLAFGITSSRISQNAPRFQSYKVPNDSPPISF
jgi:hypothetical protein